MKHFKVLLSLTLMAALLCAACSQPSSDGNGSTSFDTTYSVTVESSANGTVTASKTSGIAAGETITLTVTPR